MKRQFAIVLAFAWPLAACEREAIPVPTSSCSTGFSQHPKHTLYSAELAQYVRRNHLPGAIMLLKKPNEAVWMGATGTGNLEHQTPLQLCDQVRAGSVTKTLVAVLVLQLKDQGKINLDAKVSSLLPDVAGRIKGLEQVTVRHLLNHTSGIFDPTNESTAYQLELVNDPQRIARLSPDQFLEQYVYGTSTAFRPGTRYRYSNSDYLLLGKIAEQITRKPLHTALDELLFTPLGMTRTYLEKRDDRNVVRGYSHFYGGRQLLDVTHLDRAEGDGRAFAGLITTVADIYTFSDALFGGRVLSAASLTEMLAAQPLENGTSEYGLGIDTWTSAMGTGRGHNGSSAGLEFNWFYVADRQSTFILFTNRGGGTHKDFLDQLIMQK